MKPEEDTLPAVPTDPPAAGPDRALAPSPGLPCPAGADEEVVVDEEDVLVVEGDADAAQPASPTIAAVAAAATTQPRFLIDSVLRAPVGL
ncbi:MAG TPA: hypothetical protein VHX38_28530 [Pseudonocardiaceae bacterium]|nr:hypothetical protein [Pseudonocardiaceae bacterium]